ncbi:hypothetical protein G7054_g11005 [Neopestalotiopsis clavispora]|nr:hypothetical protein G7054_g11005 [Neopestalotiopsis clavispora]
MDNLDEFILLDLFPGQHGQEIICETRSACLDKSVPYEAVSYVWMEAGGRQSIQVSGQSVMVTSDLYDALQRLRFPARTRTLWIDQLCIDQWDNEKKAKQVDMMRLIYKQCDRCLIWFGEIYPKQIITSEDVKNTFEFIRISAEPAPTPEMQQPLIEKLSWAKASRRARVAFVALGIHGNPWWSRIWTVQESVLPESAQLIWGSQVIDWFDVRLASRNWLEGTWDSYGKIMTFEDILDDLAAPVRDLELARRGDNPLNLLEIWRYRGATDPRDKVFGLLGLISGTPFRSLQHSDYTLSVQTIYTKVMLDLLAIERGLRPFMGIRNIMNIHLPTWVSDFSRVSNVQTSERWWNHGRRYDQCHADADTIFSHTYIPEVHALDLMGIRIDDVDEVSSEYLVAYELTHVEELDLLRVIRFWHNINNWNDPKFGQEYPNGDSRINAFGATLTGDYLMNDKFQARRTTPDENQMVVQYAKTGDKIPVTELYHSLVTFVMNQSFFVSVGGYLGMGPLTMRPGDEVWILFGGRVPFILRPRRTSGQADNGYILIGQAFVHGIMHGEAVSSRRAEQRSVRLY